MLRFASAQPASWYSWLRRIRQSLAFLPDESAGQTERQIEGATLYGLTDSDGSGISSSSRRHSAQQSAPFGVKYAFFNSFAASKPDVDELHQDRSPAWFNRERVFKFHTLLCLLFNALNQADAKICAMQRNRHRNPVSGKMWWLPLTRLSCQPFSQAFSLSAWRSYYNNISFRDMSKLKSFLSAGNAFNDAGKGRSGIGRPISGSSQLRRFCRAENQRKSWK